MTNNLHKTHNLNNFLTKSHFLYEVVQKLKVSEQL
jgi:hypothetical protein